MDDDIITPFNDGDIIDILGNIKAHLSAAYNSDLDNYADCLNDALHAIEQLKRERDCFYEYYKHCETCKYKFSSFNDEPCKLCVAYNKWERREVCRNE